VGKKILKENFIQKPDIIIGSTSHLFGALAADTLARRLRVPFMFEVRDLWTQTLKDIGFFKKYHFLMALSLSLEKRLYRHAFCIVVIPPKASEFIENLGIKQKRIAWIPAGVDLERFQYGSQNSSDNVFRIRYAGTHGPSSGLDDLIRAAKIIQDKGYSGIQISLVGDGTEKFNYLRLKEQLMLKNFEFNDPIPKVKIPDFLMKADVLVHIEKEFGCSQYGGSPNKLYDYLAAGKPIVYASNFVRNILDEIGCGLYAEPGNIQALATSIIEMYEMPPEKREELGRIAREYVVGKHSIPRLADQFEECFRWKGEKISNGTSQGI
jgi:glycosyltransferase involved in cell wall biosynthesis